jgi:hypothetical protein
MGFEVQPVTVRAGHWRLAIAMVFLMAASTVAFAVMSRPPVRLAQKALSADVTALLSRTPPPLPAQLDCHDLPRGACVSATRAALGLFTKGDGPVTAAGAWKSLLCSNTFDCSPSVLTPDATPLGSVILTFGTGPSAWVNVVSRPAPTPGNGSAGPQALAWVVRWR